jgi:hypothetical protein
LEDGRGSARVSFLKRQAAAVDMASGRTEAEANVMSAGIFDTTSALQAV